MTKQEIRIQIKEITKTLSNEQKLNKSNTACNKLLETDEFIQSDLVLSYIPLKTEISPEKINDFSIKNKTLFLPKIKNGTQQMDFFQIDKNSSIENQLVKGKFDLLEPVENPQKIFNPQNYKNKNILIIVPGVAFDKNNNRLGHGMGFYDIYLERIMETLISNGNKITTVGFCFDFQIMDSIPTVPTDFKLDKVIFG